MDGTSTKHSQISMNKSCPYWFCVSIGNIPIVKKPDFTVVQLNKLIRYG